MKIVFLHTDFRVYWLPRLKFLGDFLKARGHELFILEIAGKGSPYAFSSSRLDNETCSWECLFPEHTMNELCPKRIRETIFRRLDGLKPDIVFAGAIAYPSGAAAVNYCRRRRIPVVIFDNARMADVQRSGVTNFIKRQIYANVDGMLIPAPSHDPDYLAWGVDAGKFYYGLNIVDNRYWAELARKNRETPESYPDQFLLGTGRQVPKKNWLNFLKAYDHSGIALPLLLVGNGPERKILEEYIEAQNLRNRVFLIDFLTPEKLAPLYAKAIAVILPSLHGETWGLTVNEAMACKTPVLVSRQCGCCETLCIDSKTGLSFEPTIRDMVRVLRQFEQLTPEERTEMGNRAFQLIQHWGTERFANSVLQATEDLTSRKAPGFHSFLSRMIILLWKGRYRPI